MKRIEDDLQRIVDPTVEGKTQDLASDSKLPSIGHMRFGTCELGDAAFGVREGAYAEKLAIKAAIIALAKELVGQTPLDVAL